MSIYEKLGAIQTELKAPKSQFNSFAKFNYRNLEDILEAVKPLLFQKSLSLTISDEMIEVGGRVYVKATATVFDMTSDEKVVNTACAREAVTKKGMDDSQITGATSSYARKYCLNGLFCIDDTKDADSMDNRKKTAQKQPTEPVKNPLDNGPYLEQMKWFAKHEGVVYKKILEFWQVDTAKAITNPESQQKIIQEIEAAIKAS